MNNLTHVGKTKNGFDVYVDMVHSHAATHMKDHPELFGLLQEVVANYEIDPNVGQIRFEKDMGRIIGTMDLVETGEGDDVFYAKRPNREKFTRFVRGRQSTPTSSITTELRKIKHPQEAGDAYEVFTVFIGHLTASFPYGKDDPNQENREYWKDRALIVGNQEYLPDTVTTECPW
jgi:hypothetical protein